jgi:hypothetical protein
MASPETFFHITSSNPLKNNNFDLPYLLQLDASTKRDLLAGSKLWQIILAF